MRVFKTVKAAQEKFFGRTLTSLPPLASRTVVFRWWKNPKKNQTIKKSLLEDKNHLFIRIVKLKVISDKIKEIFQIVTKWKIRLAKNKIKNIQTFSRWEIKTPTLIIRKIVILFRQNRIKQRVWLYFLNRIDLKFLWKWWVISLFMI